MLFIGRLVGEMAFAAANLAMPLVIINFALSDLVAVGSSVRIAIRLGEGRVEEANRLFSLAVVTCMLLNAVSALALVVFAPFLFSLMGASETLVGLSMSYLRVYVLFSPFTGLVFAVDNYLRICGKVKFSMSMNVVMSVLCLSLQILFLYILDLGLAFAALGSSLGMTIVCIICLSRFLSPRMALSFRKPVFSLAILKDIVAQGLPVFLNNISGRITSILMNSLLLRWGGDIAVPIYGVLMNVDGIIVPCMYGVFDSLQPAIGYNWGAERKDRVRKIAFCCVIAIAIICMASALIIQLFPGQIFSLFLDSSEASVALATTAISIMGLTYLTRWIGYAAQSFSSAIGNNRSATTLSLCNALIFPLLLMFLLQSFRLSGIWFVMPSSAFLTAIAGLVIYAKIIRRMVRN